MELIILGILFPSEAVAVLDPPHKGEGKKEPHTTEVMTAP